MSGAFPTSALALLEDAGHHGLLDSAKVRGPSLDRTQGKLKQTGRLSPRPEQSHGGLRRNPKKLRGSLHTLEKQSIRGL